jgi:hypothetical protein
LPREPGLAERRERDLGLAVRQRERSSRLGGHRSELVAAMSSRDLLELAAARARRLEVSAGEHHLDVGGKQRRPHARLRGLVEYPADRRGRSVTLPFRQA